jgi:hypothetical protein
MDAEELEATELWRAVAGSGARALVIGRQAIIMLGGPVATFDYDFWVHVDDAEGFNAALAPLSLWPNRTPEEARRVGRYVLENGIRVDVLVARVVPTVEGRRVSFEELWSSRASIEVEPGVSIALPSLEGLVATKQFGARAKDAVDIAFLRTLIEARGGRDGSG